MKNCAALKFLAILLCAAFLLTAAVSGTAIVLLGAMELYGSQTPEDLYATEQYYDFRWQARQLASEYEASLHSDATKEELDTWFSNFYGYAEQRDESLWFYRLYDSQGKLVQERYDSQKAQDAVEMTYDIPSIQYPQIVRRYVPEQEDPKDPTWGTEDPENVTVLPTVPTEAPDAPRYDTTLFEFEDADGNIRTVLMATVYSGSAYSVKLYLSPELLEEPDHWAWELLKFAYDLRYDLFWALGGSLLLFAATLVYLCCAAGRKPKTDEVRPGGLNRIPLDLYLSSILCLAAGLVILISDTFYWPSDVFEPMWLIFAGIGALGYVFCLLTVGFFFACAAQMKVKGGWWLKHTAVGFALILAWKLLRWLVVGLGKGLTRIGKAMPDAWKAVWEMVRLFAAGIRKLLVYIWEALCYLGKALGQFTGKTFRILWKGIREFFELLPHTWQWLFGAGALVFFVVIAIFGNKFMTLLAMGCGIAIVLYSAHCFGILLEATKRMSGGDLETKVDDKTLIGSFREYANRLNALAGVATEAAKQQMKSERMKAELVTNVSHDIKTPLTSIINYVDLLQKAQSQEEAEAHLEVLQRQSQRLKKLIEDLMEMSKASTGNMAVELTALDAVEAVNQALGEFSEKLQQAQITPVFLPPEGPVMLTADGRLTWRVLSNLLSNAVKYALPGTRLYIDLARLDSKVLISLKNISREQLNVSSEELMERFVRGDASRNTEGSGLGLNIARSLMELQKGQLQLLVDGDLFKATIVFPECS